MTPERLEHLINRHNFLLMDIAKKERVARIKRNLEDTEAKLLEIARLWFEKRDIDEELFGFFSDMYGWTPDSFKLGNTTWEYRTSTKEFVPKHRFVDMNKFFERQEKENAS